MIKVRNICFSYPGRPPLLQNLSVTFPDHKITTILGPNGSGKSTLLKLACRLLKPTAGDILLHDKDIHYMRSKELARQIALMSQNNPALEIPVRDLASYGRYPHQKYGQDLNEKDHQIIDHALQQVNITELQHHMVNKLSGGQRQLAYIAMALVQDTDILFFDEPTTFLDINVRFEIMELVRQLNQSGKTIIMVLHDLNLALEYSDQIILMNQGRIVTQGTPQQVIESQLLDEVFQINTHVFEEEERHYYHFTQKHTPTDIPMS